MEEPGIAVGTLIVFTSRMEELAEFYAKGLGLPSYPVREERHVGIRLENLYFGFDRVEEPATPGAVAPWFTVGDLEATFERFVKLGAKVKTMPVERPWGDRIAAVYDPDGNLVGLCQRR